MQTIKKLLGGIWWSWYYLWVLLALILTAMSYIFAFPLSYKYRVRIASYVRQKACGLAIGMSGIWITTSKISKLISLQRGKSYIIVANHKSDLDILISTSIIPLSSSFVAKAELSKVPILGYVLSQIDAIVDRKKYRNISSLVPRLAELTAIGQAIIMFPEGTRNGEKLVNEFKMGAFMVAYELRLPVVALFLPNTADLMPNRRWWGKPGIVYPVGEIFFPKDFHSAEEFKAKVHNWFLSNM